MMNSWNSASVHEMYHALSIGFLTRTSDNVDPDAPETLSRACGIVSKETPKPDLPYGKPTFGYVAEWLSEVGKPGDLDALLRHADTYLNPTWANGGLYYPRCDTAANSDGNWRHMDPFTGNAAIGYARLNVPDGQKIMWEHPWTSQEVSARPWIDNVDLDCGVDSLRGSWDAERQMMVATWRTWDGRVAEIRPVVRNLQPGLYGVYVNRSLIEKRELEGMDNEIAVDLEVGAEDVEFVVLKSALQVKSVL